MTETKTTPLHNVHVSLGARMMPFAGFDMPVQYTGIIDEHMAVRNSAGMFDVNLLAAIWAGGCLVVHFLAAARTRREFNGAESGGCSVMVGLYR